MNRISKGFTLVEILIVVIILGILAAIVIPQFTEASQDARGSALTSDLQTFRSQLELYKVQHGDQYPNGYSTDAAGFVAQLTSKTNSDGTTTGTPNLGPYFLKLPANQFTPGQLNTLGIGGAAPAGDNSTGWWFNTATNTLSPNDNGSTSDGTLHKNL